jgi:hypothetical protein
MPNPHSPLTHFHGKFPSINLLISFFDSLAAVVSWWLCVFRRPALAWARLALNVYCWNAYE